MNKSEYFKYQLLSNEKMIPIALEKGEKFIQAIINDCVINNCSLEEEFSLIPVLFETFACMEYLRDALIRKYGNRSVMREFTKSGSLVKTKIRLEKIRETR